MRSLLLACCIVLLVTACGVAPSTIPEAGSGPRGDAVGDWPDTETNNMDCIVVYPDDLKKRTYAFDGTIENVEMGEFSEDAQATPARLEVRLNEVFRGQFDMFLVMRTWDFMLPADQDVSGTRILAATGSGLDLMGCGFTRPYSEREASMWRRVFSKVPPEDCGKEVRDCRLGDAGPAPATCDRSSQEAAIAFNIDEGSYPFEVLGCNETYMALRIDFGADDCPPEASKGKREECADLNTAYFVAKDGMWELITYEERTDCAYVQELEPSFPTAFCEPGGR